MFCVIPRGETRPMRRAEEETDISLTLGKVLFRCFKLRAAPTGADSISREPSSTRVLSRDGSTVVQECEAVDFKDSKICENPEVI